MSQSEKGLRFRRTQKLLRDALIELIEESSFDALTVGEICERAMVSRAAFYRSYQDKYDLVEQVFAEAMQALFNVLSLPDTIHSPQTWEKFFEHIAQYERLYRALLGPKGSPWFVLKMRASLVGLMKEFARLAAPSGIPLYPTTDDFVPDLVAAMLVQSISWWLEQGRPYSIQEITRRCISLSFSIFRETSTWQLS
jgi:AcrR family transcriptional regulator